MNLLIVAASDTQQTGNPLVSLAPLLLLGVVFYFMLIRPQKRRTQEQRRLVNSVEEGDEVMTAAGIFGTVIEIDEDEATVLIEVAPGVRLKMLRDAIRSRLVEDEDDSEEDDDDSEEDEEADSTP
jgi:preprotein translocase subunit YajC